MSLINDALKRASQSDRNRPRPVETHAAMEPVVHRRGRALSLVLGACILLALALAGLFFWQWWNASHPSAPAKVEPIVIVAPKPTLPPVAPVVHESVPPPVAPVPASVSTSVPVPTPAPTPAPVPPPAKAVEVVWPADLKVMAIFFNKTNPRAIINGKTIEVGDLIEGIRVTKIEHDRVTVEWNGQVKALSME